MSVPFIDLKSQYQVLKKSINDRIQIVLEHGAFTNGPEVVELEKKLANYTGTKYALACASGTDALLMPLMARGIGAGDEVITTSFSFIATAETIALCGASPVFVDIELETYNLDPKQIEQKITKRTKAIMPVSLYGQTPDMDEINRIAKKHGLFVIEDAAQSFGAVYREKKSCNLSDCGGTSFYPAKPLGCYGDGGAVFTSDENLYLAMKEIREHGSESRYYHTRLGINGRLDTIQCAILLSKLERYDWELQRRQYIAQTYTEAFSELRKKDIRPPVIKSDRNSVWAQYTLWVPNRDAFQKKMSELKIPTAVHYPRTMPDQPWYSKKFPQNPEEMFTQSRLAAQHVVSLPLFPDMTDQQIQEVISAVKKSIV